MGLAAVVALASAVYGPAHKERDETIRLQGLADAVAIRVEAHAYPVADTICDGQHCDISPSSLVLGTAAGVGPTDPTAVLWLLREPMYVQPRAPELDAVELGAARQADSPRRIDVQPQGIVGVEWRHLIEQWDDWSPDVMLRIIDCESHGDANAVSPGGYNVGAFQINVVHGYSVEQMTDPVTSTAIAHDIWLSQGYRAWSCY